MTFEELLEDQVVVSNQSDDLAVEMARQIAQKRKSTRRHGLVAGAITGGVLLASAGGLSAAAATGVWPFRWVDGPDAAGTHIVTVASGAKYACPFEMHVDAEYSSPGTYAQIREGEVAARNYLRSIDVNQIKPDPALMPSNDGGTEGMNDPQYWTSAWTAAVQQNIELNMRRLGLPPPSLEGVWSKCVPLGSK